MTSELERRHGQRGDVLAATVADWTSARIFGAEPAAAARLVAEAGGDVVYDHFWRPLPLGTGGRRGPVGFGPNRINRATVAQTVQGHCDYLRATGPSRRLSVVVANDVRVFHDLAGAYRFLGDDNPLLGLSSRSLARLCCEVYAGNGIVAHLVEPDDPTATLTTPELSYAVRHLAAAGGVNISASHNHPDDNGIKVYDARGGQFVTPEDDAFAACVGAVERISLLAFDEARAAGLVSALPDDVVTGYHEVYRRQYAQRRGTVRLPAGTIVYTPLNGCGERTVAKGLRGLGFDVAVPDVHRADGTFAAIPFRAPNPEVPAATRGVHPFADRVGSTIVLSSDPDADRIGVDVKVDGRWRHLDGNQIAAILAAYLLVDPDGPRMRGLVIETLVTTRLVSAIARAAGAEVVDDLLVGFKYVGRLLEERADAGGGQVPLVLAAEESHGVLTTSQLRDKDALSGAIYLAHLHLLLAGRGSNLVEYHADLLRIHRPHATASRSIVLRGSAGVTQTDTLMRSLRDDPPTVLHGARIVETIDYWRTDRWGEFASETDRQSRNIVQWRAQSLTVTVRPSGTEPKIKMYVEAHPAVRPDADDRTPDLVADVTRQAQDAARDLYRLMLDRLGRPLSEAALDLPDFVDLGEKEHFDSAIVPQLGSLLAADRYDAREVTAWLGKATAGMVPGADPLPALRGALGRLSTEWSNHGRAAAARCADLLRQLPAAADGGAG
nr:hypothetical protein OHB51_17320 [Micromonospora sp. NBC_00855]